ncbi:hypothetical protein ALC62_10611, partial [Cyphomyrmex costatus]
SAGIITKRIAPPRHLFDTLTVTCEIISSIFSRIPSLFLRRLLHLQVPWHVLLAANSAQSLAASESLGRPSCRFQVGAKYLQVEDTCKSKHSKGEIIFSVNILLINRVRIELDRVTIIMFITRNNNMQAGPAVINSSDRAAGYRPGLNYR